jgi:hypothetical protein
MGKTWDKVKGVLASGAPMIGTLIGGPGGAAVGALVSSALGVENTPEAIEKELTGNPEAMLKIKEIEINHRTQLEQMALEDTKARLQDTQDARRAEVERMKAGGSNRFMYGLAGLIVVGFFGVIAALFFKAIPEASQDVAYIIIGGLVAQFGQVVTYFFGSSKGSSDKTAMLMKGK